MQAWLMDDYKGIGGLRLAAAPDPMPEPGEVILQLNYAALNPADAYLAEKLYPAKPRLPHILGRDGLGTVIEAGKGVKGVRVGDRRALLLGEAGINRPGTFAQRVAVPEQNLVEIPAGWSETEAVGAPLVYLTAYEALTMWGQLPASAVVLVTGASGGVGVAAVQLGAALGYKVVALSRSAEKCRRLEQLGAALTYNPGDPKWSSTLKGALEPRRVDLAIDNIGGSLLPEVISTLGELGRVSLVGRLAGPVPSFNTATLFFRRIRLGGMAVGGCTIAQSHAAWQEILRLLGRTGARPQVDEVFPFDRLPQAFERLAHGPMGKVLLAVPSSG